MKKEIQPDFYSIYDAHYDRIKGFILAKVRDKWIAEDLTHDAFLRAFRNISSLQDPAKVSAWIFRIAHNICLDHFRRCGTSALRKMSKNRENHANVVISAQAAIEKQQMNSCIQQKVRLLPKPYREIVWLADIMELSHREIADLLNLSPENVKVRLHRARGKLKVILQNHCQFEKDERNVLICGPKSEGSLNCSAPSAKR